ncbi:hypothetical protein NRA35_13565 [Acinetobacter baumannii]|uniref:hypothetical protein n=1 Tax=Acinetobacter baumannii TaxID=470 RepID=UPI000BF7CB59|nr:hypothetical protein [Acinetobacter baumannii]MDC5100848.1 hypothetical protein [Acinetobacter baumannii]MDC5216654.1 hypothetical protein [Acinetobacter baumannii]
MSHQEVNNPNDNENEPFPWWGYLVIFITYLIAFKVYFPPAVKMQLQAIDFFFAPMDLIQTGIAFDFLAIGLIIASTFLVFFSPLFFSVKIVKELQKQF